MTIIEFTNMIEAYGADPKRWPDERRAAGQLFLKTNPHAQSMLDQEAVLDAALNSLNPPAPSELLRARILKSATGSAVPAAAVKPRRPAWHAIAAAFVAVLALGFVSYTLSQPNPAENSGDDVWLEAASDLGVTEIYDWVHAEDGQ